MVVPYPYFLLKTYLHPLFSIYHIMKFKILFITIVFCFTSCKLVSLGQDEVKTLKSEPVLGVIGVLYDDVISSKFSETGMPKLQEKIKLGIQYKFFNKGSLRRYNSGVIEEDQKLRIVDSLDLRPGYFKLEINDKVGYINSINHLENKEVKAFLEDTKNNQVVSGLEIFFPQEISDHLSRAKGVYLINSIKNLYSLEILNNDGTKGIIDFNQGTSFGYQFMSFCWKENYRHKADVAALREVNSSCPGNTLKNPDKIYSKDIFEKIN